MFYLCLNAVCTPGVTARRGFISLCMGFQKAPCPHLYDYKLIFHMIEPVDFVAFSLLLWYVMFPLLPYCLRRRYCCLGKLF